MGTLVAYYSFSYIPSRERYFVESRLRELAVLAGQIEAAVATQKTSVQGAVRDLATNYPDRIGTPDDELVIAKLARAGVTWGACNPATPTAVNGAARAGSAALPTPASAAPPTMPAAESTPATTPAHSPSPTAVVAKVDVYLTPEAAGVPEETSPFVGRSDTAPGWATTSRDSTLYFASTTTSGTDLICPTARLSEIVEPLLQANQRDVQDVVVAQDEEVLFQRGRRDLRITAAKFVGPSPASGDAKDGEKQLPQQIWASSASMDIVLGGQVFKLFVQPMQIEGLPHLFVATYLPKKDFDATVRSVSFGALAQIPLLLILVVLAVPAIKVATMSRDDRLKASDVALLAVCLVIMAAVATSLAVSLVSYASLDVRLDEDLRIVSEKMQKNMKTEITQITLALERFIDTRVCRQEPCDALPRIVQMLGTSATVEGASPDKAEAILKPARGLEAFREALKKVTDEYPFAAMLIWAGPGGWQREKWTRGAATTPLSNVSDTPSFKDPVSGRLWGWPRDSNGVAAFAFHLRRSRNSGAILPTVSMPITVDGKTVGVATMVPQLISLWRPVLPPGFTFAVIQRDGRVVFHSSMAPKIHENFFDECDVGGAIRSVIEGSSQEFLNGTYHARAKRFFVSPIPHSPWTLIVMRDPEAQRSQLLDVLAAWVVLFSLFAVVLLAALAACIRWFGRDWYWPSEARAIAYARSSLVLAGVIAASAARMACHSGGALTIGAVVALVLGGMLYTIRSCAAARNETVGPETARPTVVDSTLAWLVLGAAALVAWLVSRDAIAGLLFAIVVISALANALRWPSEAHAGRHWQRDFLLTGALLLVVVSVIPSLVLLQDAWILGAEAFVRYGQLELSKQIDSLRRENADEYRESGIEDPDKSLLTKRQLGRLLPGPGENAEIVTAGVFGSLDTQKRSAWCTDHGTLPGSESEANMGSADWGFSNIRGDCALGPSPWLLGRAFCRLLSPRSSAAVMAELPVYHEESLQLRELFASQAADERWVWRRAGDGGELCWYAPPVEPPAEAGKNPLVATRLKSLALPDVTKVGFSGALWLTVAAALSMAGLLALLRWLSTRVVGLGRLVVAPPGPSANVQRARGVFALGGRGPRGVEPPEASLFDLRAEEPKSDGARKLEATSKVVIVDHLEDALRSPERAARALEVLETLLADQPRPLVVLSDLDPLTQVGLLPRENGADADAAAAAQSVRARWARCLEQLCLLPPSAAVADLGQLIRWAMAVGDEAGLKSLGAQGVWSDDARRAIEKECQWTPRLRGIAQEILAFDRPFPEAAIQVLAASRAHYRSLWERRPEDEQLTLAQLGREGFVNPKRWRVAGALAGRGLIRFDLGPRVMNDSFRRFVARQEHTLRRGERAAEGSVWHRTRGVLTYALIGGGLLLYFSQPEGWAQLVGALGALATAATKASEVLGLFRRGAGEAR